MPIPESTAVTLGDISITLYDLLRHLHCRGVLASLLRDAAKEAFLLHQAKGAGLRVASEELQRAADRVRLRQGLTSAEKTHAWLARRRLSVLAFEDTLERALLIAKLKDHLTRDRTAAHFEQHHKDYDRLRVRQITVPQEDLARELLSQVQDEGRDFAELAPQQQAGSLVCLRRQLPPAVAAALPSTAGAVAGPVATPHGFTLVRLEEFQPAQLDAATRAAIRAELFEAWLREQLKQRPLHYPLLDELS